MISQEPLRTLPHRDPFVWVSRLMERNAEGTEGRVELDIKPEMDVFRGHFPGEPVFPGVLQMEAAAQACLWVVIGPEAPKGAKLSVRFVGVDGFKFRKAVTPPSVLSFHVKEIKMLRGLRLWEINVSCAGQTVADGKLWLTLLKENA